MIPLLGGDSEKLALYTKMKSMSDMISLRFSENTTYAVGDYCLYFNGVFDGLYEFTKEKTPGNWDLTKVEQVSLCDILKRDKEDREVIKNKVKDITTKKTLLNLTSFKVGDVLSLTEPYTNYNLFCGIYQWSPVPSFTPEWYDADNFFLRFITFRNNGPDTLNLHFCRLLLPNDDHTTCKVDAAFSATIRSSGTISFVNKSTGDTVDSLTIYGLLHV